MASLTVTVVTLDDEELLPRLFASLTGLADQIVVVDLGSTDRTLELARTAGAELTSWSGAGSPSPEALALSRATGDYVLHLQAGDVLDPSLAAAVRSELARPEGPRHPAYRLRGRLHALGHTIRFGQPWREAARLSRREGNRSDSSLTGREGGMGRLPGRYDRTGFRDGAEARRKLSLRAEQQARARYREGRRWHSWYTLRGPVAFLRRAVLWLGLLDGPSGLRWAYLHANAEAEEARWLRRLDREIGGAARRSAWASQLRALGRWMTVALASKLWPPPRRAMPAPGDIRKVLVIRPDERVGNQLLTTPLLRALKLGLPRAEVHLLAAARRSAVVGGLFVDRLVPFEKRLAFRAPARFLGELRALRRERYDVVIEAAHWSAFSLTASLLARIAAGRGAVVGHLRGDSQRFLSHPVRHDPAHTNDVRAKLELLGPLALPCRGLAPETDLGADSALAEQVLAAAGVRRPYAVLNPGARMADRRWPPSAHAEVARGLIARGLGVLVVWGPGEEHLARKVAEGSGARLAPPTSLDELAALFRGARLCVSNNSGPMHLAVAVGTPTVGVFAAGDAARWGHELPFFQAAEPQSDADAAAVLSACDRLLEAEGQRPPPNAKAD